MSDFDEDLLSAVKMCLKEKKDLELENKKLKEQLDLERKDNEYFKSRFVKIISTIEVCKNCEPNMKYKDCPMYLNGYCDGSGYKTVEKIIDLDDLLNKAVEEGKIN